MPIAGPLPPPPHPRPSSTYLRVVCPAAISSHPPPPGRPAQYKRPEGRLSATMRPRPRLEDEPPVRTGPFEAPMYFVTPGQLLDIFTEMEESNLFLIQNGQVRCRARVRVRVWVRVRV